MMPFSLLGNLQLALPRTARIVCCRCCSVSGVYLMLEALPIGRPRPDLGERLRQLDVDERIRLAELDRYGARPLLASRLLENMLRPVVEESGGARAMLLRLGWPAVAS